VGSGPGLRFSYWLDPAGQNAVPNPNAISSSGTYYIKATNTAGCTQTLPVSATFTGSPTLIVTNPATVCTGSIINLTDPSITIGSDPGLSYSYWQDRFGTIALDNPTAITSGGNYYIKATAQGGCFMIRQVSVSYNQAPTALFAGDQTICPNTPTQININLTGNGPWDVTYTDGTNTYTIKSIGTTLYPLTVSPANTTTYSILSVSDATCTNTNSSAATVTVIPGPPGMRYPTVSTFANVPVQLSARDLGPNYSYTWTPAAGLDFSTIRNPIFNYGLSSQYYISIMSPNGCLTVDTVQVNIMNPLDTGLTPDLLVPKAWTPNNDGMNDILYPITIHIRQIVYFRIFDRWGQLVYETNILGKGWDGIYKGRPQVSDVYTWTVEGIGDDGTVIRKAGNSILLR
jgi:gliding motility-associated-like protein